METRDKRVNEQPPSNWNIDEEVDPRGMAVARWLRRRQGWHLQICPTMVGGGRRLFPSLPSYARLKRVNVRTYDTGVVFLHYEPQREV